MAQAATGWALQGDTTGDSQTDAAQLSRANVICTTPEKWDGVTRQWRRRDYARHATLLIIDEISFIGTSLFARMHFRIQQAKRAYFSERGLDPNDGMFGGLSMILVGDFGQLDSARYAPSSGHQCRRGADLVRRQVPDDAHNERAPGAGGHALLVRPHPLVGQPRSLDFAARRARRRSTSRATARSR